MIGQNFAGGNLPKVQLCPNGKQAFDPKENTYVYELEFEPNENLLKRAEGVGPFEQHS